MSAIKKIFLNISVIGSLPLFIYGQSIFPLKPVEEPSVILRSEVDLVRYDQDYLRLSEDFIGFDDSNRRIDKRTFFKLFSEGDYLPLRLISKNKLACYKLYKVSPTLNDGILSILKDWGELDYKYFKMEGRQLPGFDFRDIKGNIYNRETTRNKIVVIKCWYLACSTCREEIPTLNKIVDQYRKRKDIVFISLAFDSKDDLQKFSKDNIFKYALIPDQKNYLMKELKIYLYPTQMIINKKGLISKVLVGSDDLASIVNTEASK